MRSKSEKPPIVLFVESVCALMPGWSLSRAKDMDGYYVDHGCSMTGPDGAELWFYVKNWGANPGKVEISGCYPRHDKVSSPDSIKIGTNIERAPAAVVKDLERRLLPDYRKALGDWQARVRDTDDATAKQAVCTKALKNGLRVQNDRDDNRFSVGFEGGGSYDTMDVYVDSGCDVKVEFRLLTFEQAEKLMAWARANLKGAAGKGGK